jgi:transposase
MATRKAYQQSRSERQRRRFSEAFKQKKVREIEQKITSIAEVSREYEVTATNISKWLRKYGNNYMKGVRTIVEAESDTRRIIELKATIAELERIIGQKQVQLDFKDKMIQLAEETYEIDIKKKFEYKPSSGIGNIVNNSTEA